MNERTIQMLVDLGIDEAEAREGDLRRADLRGALLGSADLEGANLEGALLGSAYLGGRANLRRTDLEGADLAGANLERANLRFACLNGARLREAKFGGADLYGAVLERADLAGAYLEGAYNIAMSHDMVAEVIRQGAGGDIRIESFAGLLLVHREWCWCDFISVALEHYHADVCERIKEILFANPAWGCRNAYDKALAGA